MIHGQCIVRVLGDFKIERVIGVDDFTANNMVLKKIYEIALPPHISGGVFTKAEALVEIQKSIDGAKHSLVLVKSPETALSLFRKTDLLPKHLNIGPMSSRKDTVKATMYAYLTEREIVAIEELTAMGVRVYFNQIIDQKTEEWADIKQRL